MEEIENDGLLAIGGKFGNYDVLKLLGSGGMGEVYLLRSVSNGEFYACKVMLPSARGMGARQESEWRKRFANEAMFAMKVMHRNLIRVYDAGEDPQTHLCFIIMDYMAGGTLSERIHAKGRLEVGEAVRIALKVATALDVAHRSGIVHRDIKPDNIMFDDDGEPHLADLGIAKFATSNVTMTNAKMVIGTPSYMAPEQMMDSHKVDARADVYSLGIVLYEMLTGTCPHENTTVMELLSRVMKGEELQNVCKIRSDVSPDVGYVLSLMTANKVGRRPADARAAARMLYAAYKGRLNARDRIGKILAGFTDRFANSSAVFKASVFLAGALCAVAAALAFALMRGASRGGTGGGGDRSGWRVTPANSSVQTNEVDIALYSVVVVTNQVGEIVTVTNGVPSQVDGQSASFVDWEELEDEYDYVPKATTTGKPPAADGSHQSLGGTQLAVLGDEPGATELQINVASANGQAAAGHAALAPSTGGATSGVAGGAAGSVAAGTGKGAAGAGDVAQRVDEEVAPADGYTPLKGSFSVDAVEVKLSNVPSSLNEDMKRRLNEYDSRFLEWGGLGCIVYGRVELERDDDINGIATWAWMKPDGSFTAAMHPATSEGRIVFLHHGYQRLCVNVPQALEQWRKDSAFSLGVLTMRKLTEDQAGEISFKLRLPSKVASAALRIELASNYPLGFNRTKRPNMSATIVKQKIGPGRSFTLKGCARDRYVVTVDSPLCRLYSKSLVLGDDVPHALSDCMMTNGIANLGEIRLRYPRRAEFLVQDEGARMMKEDSLIDNRGSVDFFPGISARFRSVDGDESILRLEWDDDDVELYDCGPVQPSKFNQNATFALSGNKEKSKDSIIRPGRIYCLGYKRSVPDSGTLFSLEKY